MGRGVLAPIDNLWVAEGQITRDCGCRGLGAGGWGVCDGGVGAHNTASLGLWENLGIFYVGTHNSRGILRIYGKTRGFCMGMKVWGHGNGAD